MENYIWLIPLLPLLAFLVNFTLGKRLSHGAVAGIGIAAVAGSLLLSVLVFLRMQDGAEALNQEWYTWIPAGSFQVGIGAYVDQLTSLMLLVVTSVSLLVHVYSTGYMHGDPGTYRFFAYLPLFTFSMLMLVLANNFLELYVFWEAVGLCSYLLIGFWYTRPSASAAAMKAFLVNRVGDFGFGLGIVVLFSTFGTLAYVPVFERAEEVSQGALLLITLLLFTGAMGKSAQWPLHTWLPDAMEGPTPVSALIHAATMVTAGVYMVARANPLYNAAQGEAGGALTVVAVIGLVTALLGATIAIVQTDIKRVMAYSTISQLGYMFFALGIGAYVSAIFHLFTHAFFKALLFLASGSVMHGMNNETDMRKMGGLRKYMPQTFVTLTIGALALAGFPGTAGFWSKDEILGLAYIEHHYWIYGLGTLASFLTAFYITRVIALTFLGEPRFSTQTLDAHGSSASRAEGAAEEHGAAHAGTDQSHAAHGGLPHESPPSMTIPLWILAIAAVFIGFVGVPPEDGRFHHFLEPVFAGHGEAVGEAAEHEGGFTGETVRLMLVATAVSLAGIGLSLLVYWRRVPALDPTLWANRLSFVYRLLLNKYYFDEIYDFLFVRPSRALGSALWRFDARGVDGAVNFVASETAREGTLLRRTQTGFVGNYALGIGAGVVALVAYLFFQ